MIPGNDEPLITLPGTLDAVLEEISGQLRAFLLVAVGTGAVPVGVALGGLLELGNWSSGLVGHGWSIHVVVVARLLSRCASSSRALWRRPRAILLGSGGASQVLVGELVSKASVGVVGAWGVGSRLVGGILVGIVIAGLALVLRSVLVVLDEVALGVVAATRVLLLLLLVLHGGLPRAGGEDGLWECRGGGWIRAVGSGEAVVTVASKVEEQAVVIRIHRGINSSRLDSSGRMGEGERGMGTASFRR